MKDLDKEERLLLAKHKQIHHTGFSYDLRFLFIGFICLNHINMMMYFRLNHLRGLFKKYPD